VVDSWFVKRKFLFLNLKVLLCGAAATGLAVQILKPGIVDDGFIFFRYAENLAHGLGPVFNPGEHVEGFSSPLWTFVLAFCSVVIPDLELVSRCLGYVCALGLVGTVAAGLRTRLRDEIRPDLYSVPVLLVCLPPVVFYGFSGMDHPLFALMVTAAMVSSLADGELGAPGVRTFVLVVLATLARPEGILAGLCIYTYLRLRVTESTHPGSTQRLLKSLVLYAMFLSVVLGARYLYFGQLLPNTYNAKVASVTVQRLMQGGSYLFRAAVAFSPVLFLCCIAGAVMRVRRIVPPPGVSLLFGWLLLYGSYVVYVGGDHFPMFRFLLPVIPALILLLGLLWFQAFGGLSGPVFQASRIALPVALLVAAALCQSMEGERARREPRLAEKWADRGRWLAGHTPPDAVLATTSVGAIGFFSGRTVVDMLGLTDTTVGKQGRIYPDAAHGHARFHTDYIFDRAPDLVVYYRTGSPERLGRMLTPPELINKTYAYALYDFASDPRCAERYEHVVFPLEDGSVIEMQKKKGFSFR